MSQPTVRHDLSPVILAGGSGTRLWPLSRRTYPKHLIALTSEDSLLQQCARRVLAVAAPEATITVGALDQRDLIRHQLALIDPALVESLILEPAARNTAAACCAAALHARERHGGAHILWVCAADHVMGDTDNLYAALSEAMDAAAAGRLVTFGIEPAYAEPGFGYIQVGEPLGERTTARTVVSFIEKPERAAAEAMLREGGHLWNSGMFVFRADVFLEEIGLHAPAILEVTRAAMAEARGVPLVPGPAYAAIPSEPVDKAVMERSNRVAVVPCDPRWSDVGSWRAVWEALPQDEAGNATRGDVILEGAEGCLVLGAERLVAAVGVRDLAIIDTADALMVADLGDSGAVKAVVGRLQAADRDEARGYPLEIAEWGERRRCHRRGATVVSEVVLAPGASVSLSAGPAQCLHLFGETLARPIVLGPNEEATLVNDGAGPQAFVEVAAPARESTTP